MFLVVIVYSLIIALAGQTTADTLFMRQGYLKNQSYFASRAGVNLGLKAMVESAGWETTHDSLQSALEMQQDGARLLIWATPTDQPNVLYVHCRATFQDLTEEVTATVTRGSDIQGTVFAEVNRDGVDSLFFTTPSAPSWTIVPPAPYKYYVHDGATDTIQLVDTGKLASNLGFVCPDDENNLYVAMRRDGADAVYRYSPDGTWTVLPPVISAYYDGAGNLITRPDKVAGDLQDLTSDGKNRLVVRLNRDNIDTIYTLDVEAWENDPNTQWTTIKPAPRRYYNDAGLLKDGSGFSPNLRYLSMEPGGTLYAVQAVDKNPDTMFRYDFESQTWSVLPPPPRVLYKKDGTVLVQPTLYPHNFKGGMAAGPDGEVYVSYDPDDYASTIYKFSPSGSPDSAGVLPGQWTWLPPPPKRVNTSSGVVVQTGFCGNLRYLKVDKDGNLYARWARDGRDEIMAYSKASGYWQLLKPLPLQYYSSDGVLHTADANWNVNIQSLGVGSPQVPSTGGQVRWLSTY